MTNSEKPHQKRDEARRLHRAGHSYREIVKILGVAKSTVSVWCAGVTKPKADRNHPENSLSDEIKQATFAALRTGRSYSSVAKEFGVSKAALITNHRAKLMADPQYQARQLEKKWRTQVNGTKEPIPVRLRRTPAETAQLRLKAIELRKQGMLYREIGNELNLAKSVLVRWLSDVPGDAPARAKYRELKKLCRSEYASGKRFAEITRDHGVSDATLTLWVKDLAEKRRADPAYVFTSTRIDPTKRVNNNKRMTDEQVIELRREVKREKCLNSRKWTRRLGVSGTALTLAARGVQYAHLNHIESPATIEDTKRKPKLTRTLLEARQKSFSELIELVRMDPSMWTLQLMAEYMCTDTGGGYKASHIAKLLGERAPDLLGVVRDQPVPKVATRKPIHRRVIKALCCVCENSFDTTDPDQEVCDNTACHAVIADYEAAMQDVASAEVYS